jgi:hypothetical protein
MYDRGMAYVLEYLAPPTIRMQRCATSHAPFSRSGNEAGWLEASIYPSLKDAAMISAAAE